MVAIVPPVRSEVESYAQPLGQRQGWPGKRRWMLRLLRTLRTDVWSETQCTWLRTARRETGLASVQIARDGVSRHLLQDNGERASS